MTDRQFTWRQIWQYILQTSDEPSKADESYSNTEASMYFLTWMLLLVKTISCIMHLHCPHLQYYLLIWGNQITGRFVQSTLLFQLQVDFFTFLKKAQRRYNFKIYKYLPNKIMFNKKKEK